MYERSANVLENYYNTLFGLDQKINLQIIFNEYAELVEKTKEYAIQLDEEDKVINEFDELATEIRNIQQEQKRIHRANLKLEEERDQIFDDLDDDSTSIDKKIKKIENSLKTNNDRVEELGEDFVKTIAEFSEKQKERNKISRARRIKEKDYIQKLQEISRDIKEIDKELINQIKKIINSESNEYEEEVIKIMINNGKGEKVPFNEEVIKISVNAKKQIMQKVAECYITAYDKAKKILVEINNDDIKLTKHEVVIRNINIKIAFLNAENNYIVNFLDYERMMAINGKKTHEQLMMQACNNFELDMEQFNNLYEILLREISGKSTKKIYAELFNKTYLSKIEEKEKKVENEINNINIKSGAFINSNYWRIQEIRNVYEVFQNEISENLGKDLEGYKLVEYEDLKFPEDDIFKSEIEDEEVEYVEEYEYDEDDNFEIEEDEFEEDFNYDIDKPRKRPKFDYTNSENNEDDYFEYDEEFEEEDNFDEYSQEDEFEEDFDEEYDEDEFEEDFDEYGEEYEEENFYKFNQVLEEDDDDEKYEFEYDELPKAIRKRNKRGKRGIKNEEKRNKKRGNSKEGWKGLFRI